MPITPLSTSETRLYLAKNLRVRLLEYNIKSARRIRAYSRTGDLVASYCIRSRESIRRTLRR